MSFAAELLHFPDLFPARHSGERWGGERLALEFAGGPNVFRGLSRRRRRLRSGPVARTQAGQNTSTNTVNVWRTPAVPSLKNSLRLATPSAW